MSEPRPDARRLTRTLAPLMIVVDAKGSDDPQAAFTEADDEIEGLKGVATVTPAAPNKAGDTATITVVPDSKPSSIQTEDLVHSIRDRGTGIKAGTDAEVLVTGATGMNIDSVRCGCTGPPSRSP